MNARTFIAVAACALVAGGCGSSPNSTFYAIAPTTSGDPSLTSASGPRSGAPVASPRLIKLRRITIPGYLDRPEIVRRVVDYRLGIAPYERWGEPLDEMLGRVMAEDLENRLPGRSVFSETGSITADPDVTIAIDIRRFDLDDDGKVNLVAEVAIEPKGARTAPVSMPLVLRAAPAGPSTRALVATMSALVAQLSSRVAVLAASGTSSGP